MDLQFPSYGIHKKTSSGCLGRIGEAFKSLVIGLGLIVAGIGCLFWNEGRAVKTAQALEEGQSLVQIVGDNSKIDPAMEGKLVYMTGTAATDDEVRDLHFGIFHQGIKLSRHVKYYQWRESTRKEEHKNLDGSKEDITIYTYDKEWVSEPVNSGKFHEGGHNNTVCLPEVQKEEWQAENVAFGAFKLNKGQVARVDSATPYPLAGYQAPESLTDNSAVTGDELYVTWPTDQQLFGQVSQKPVAFDRQAGKIIYGYDPQTGKPVYGYDRETNQAILDPQAVQPARPSTAKPDQPVVGDMRVSWTVAAPKEEVSLIAVQTQGTFAPYVSESSGYEVDLFAKGTKTPDEMFQDAHDGNNVATWGFRICGWLALFIGFKLFLKPTSAVLETVPFLGTLADIGMGLVAFVLAALISLVAVAVAWLFYRPVLGIILLAMVAAPIVWSIKRKKTKTPQIQA